MYKKPNNYIGQKIMKQEFHELAGNTRCMLASNECKMLLKVTKFKESHSCNWCFVISQDHNDRAIAVGATLAHEMGHNLGMDHDDSSACACSGDSCIMAAALR